MQEDKTHPCPVLVAVPRAGAVWPCAQGAPRHWLWPPAWALCGDRQSRAWPSPRPCPRSRRRCALPRARGGVPLCAGGAAQTPLRSSDRPGAPCNGTLALGGALAAPRAGEDPRLGAASSVTVAGPQGRGQGRSGLLRPPGPVQVAGQVQTRGPAGPWPPSGRHTDPRHTCTRCHGHSGRGSGTPTPPSAASPMCTWLSQPRELHAHGRTRVCVPRACAREHGNKAGTCLWAGGGVALWLR